MPICRKCHENSDSHRFSTPAHRQTEEQTNEQINKPRYNTTCFSEVIADVHQTVTWISKLFLQCDGLKKTRAIRIPTARVCVMASDEMNANKHNLQNKQKYQSSSATVTSSRATWTTQQHSRKNKMYSVRLKKTPLQKLQYLQNGVVRLFVSNASSSFFKWTRHCDFSKQSCYQYKLKLQINRVLA